MTTRSYRWLLILLAVVGLTADQWSKYGMFRWLYHQGPENPTTDKTAAFVAWHPAAPAWVAGTAPGISGGRYDVLPGWFGFIAQYNPPKRTTPDDGWRNTLQTWSAPKLPHVNRGALFGMGANHDGSEESEKQAEGANTLFAIISLIAAGGITIWMVLRGNRADAWICAALGLILGGTVGNLYDRVVFHGVRDFLFFYKIDWPVFNVADCCLVCGAIMLVLHAVFVKPPQPNPQATTAAATPMPAAAPTPAG
ncbi:MAG: signal peptidase II [Fimbriiglobus sp.]|nr:signal peptidase II [Fimbriiglobus sp.]